MSPSIHSHVHTLCQHVVRTQTKPQAKEISVSTTNSSRGDINLSLQLHGPFKRIFKYFGTWNAGYYDRLKNLVSKETHTLYAIGTLSYARSNGRNIYIRRYTVRTSRRGSRKSHFSEYLGLVSAVDRGSQVCHTTGLMSRPCWPTHVSRTPAKTSNKTVKTRTSGDFLYLLEFCSHGKKMVTGFVLFWPIPRVFFFASRISGVRQTRVPADMHHRPQTLQLNHYAMIAILDLFRVYLDQGDANQLTHFANVLGFWEK